MLQHIKLPGSRQKKQLVWKAFDITFALTNNSNRSGTRTHDLAIVWLPWHGPCKCTYLQSLQFAHFKVRKRKRVYRLILFIGWSKPLLCDSGIPLEIKSSCSKASSAEVESTKTLRCWQILIRLLLPPLLIMMMTSHDRLRQIMGKNNRERSSSDSGKRKEMKHEKKKHFFDFRWFTLLPKEQKWNALKIALIFFFKNGPFPASFYLFSSLLYSWLQTNVLPI